jgi:nitrate reductase gamma subunit
MPVTLIIYAILYAAALVFLAGCVARAVRYARAPLHLRWEVYPVPHEEPQRVRHGGSYFEETDWWTRPAQFNLLGELKVMLPEMLFLKGLWEFNRQLWYRSFAFHLGLYLLTGTLALLVLSALLWLAAPGLIFGATGRLLHYVYMATGVSGVALAVVGALGLLHRRLTDEELANSTTGGDIFNLLFFLVTLGTLAAGYVFAGPEAPGVLGIAYGWLTWDASLEIPPVLAAGLILGALLASYIPLTHMSHFIAKYFTYHSVRWDDTPGRHSAKLQKRFAEYLTYRPTWSAPHVGADGAKTWADIATANPAPGAKK